jgi:transcriptional regulator GlxA family with amidase domain
VAADEAREIVLVVCDGVVVMDLAGPLQVLHSAGGYRVRLASPDGRAVRTDVGVRMEAAPALPDIRWSVDTLLVAGYSPRSGGGIPAGWARQVSGWARRVASVCTGALVLAEAGLLDGRRATTHRAVCEDLATRFPHVAVQPDAIWVRDGPVLTSAGVTAGIDLALALVAEDLGADRARSVARHLVVFLRRPGGQTQFNASTDRGSPHDPILRRTINEVRTRPEADHSLLAMAARAAVSERHLRLFRREMDTTPARYVEQIRVHKARKLLEVGAAGVVSIAHHCGFGSSETMRRAFLRALGVTPSEYRRHFQAPPPDGTEPHYR